MTDAFSTMSANAHDMFKIAVHLANFDHQELFVEIFRIQRNKAAKVNLPTVLRAMDNVYRRHGEYPDAKTVRARNDN